MCQFLQAVALKYNKNVKKIQLTCPLIAIGRSKIPCMPKIVLCGGLIIDVPNNDPNTLIVKVPPPISSTAMSPFLA
jgi:hypothetical protein